MKEYTSSEKWEPRWQRIGYEAQCEYLIQAVVAFTPFWQRAIKLCGGLLEKPPEKIAQLLHYTEAAPALMRGWVSGNIKLVKARKKEVWSATGFVWNAVTRTDICDYPMAPLFRNAHGIITSALHATSGGYKLEDIPGVLYGTAYDIACVRQLYPFDRSDFMGFPSLQTRTKEHDPVAKWMEMSIHLGLEEPLRAVLRDVPRVLTQYGDLPVFEPPAYVWRQHGSLEWHQLRSYAIEEFNRR